MAAGTARFCPIVANFHGTLLTCTEGAQHGACKMRLPVAALSAFSLLVICDPALARGKSSHRHLHSDPHHARLHGKVDRVRHTGPHVGPRVRVHHRVARGHAAWRAPAGRPRWSERGPAVQPYGLFPGDDRYPVRGMVAVAPRRSAPEIAETRVGRRDRIAGSLAGMISRHAQMNGVPEPLVRRVVMRESGGNPRAVGRGGAMGLMQIKTATARAMGYGGSAAGLLDPETNLTYAVRYLAGAYRVAGGNHDRAVSNYARGYYYAAKRMGVSPYRRPEWNEAYATF
jgi:hypothetical protein